MKRLTIILSVLLISVGCLTSCEDFLDKSPDMGLSESDVYKDYNSFRGFLDGAYAYLDQIYKYQGTNNGRSHPGTFSDELGCIYNSAESRVLNSGNWLSQNITAYEIGNSSDNGGTSIYHSYKGLRIVNRVIRDVDKVNVITGAQKDELLGQAYFLRAWFYFQLIKRYGGMPKFDMLFIGEGEEDRPRMTYHESHDWMVSDLDKAISLLPDVWDTDNTGRPTKVAAMAVKSMACLYDASPLMQNDLKTIEIKNYDKERAAVAAKAAYDVIKYVTGNPQFGYALMPGGESYRHIFYWTAPPYTQPEYLWYNRSQATPGATVNKNEAFTRYLRTMWLPGVYAEGTGNDAVAYCCPTQNMVDMFEKCGPDGQYWPIADALSGYDPQDPYKDRDPRFANNILVPGEKWGQKVTGEKLYITLYQGGDLYKEAAENKATNNRQVTGYMCKKYIWEGADTFMGEYRKYRNITVYIRFAQIYLDFAEASFEATGSATAKVDGCDMTAEEALNVIRTRAGVSDIPEVIVNDPVAFREAYRRERCVELMFENNRWWDIRRWMIAHELFGEQYPIKGIKAIPVDPNHAKVADKSTLKFTYEVVDVIPEQRVFEMRNYWYPFSMNDVASLNNLVQNPLW